jgi:predicted Zn-dependent protease
MGKAAAPAAGEANEPAGDEARRPGEAEVPAPAKAPDLTPEIVDRWLADHPNHPDVLELAVRRALAANSNAPTLEMVPLLEQYAAARPVDPLPHKTLARLYLSLPVPAAQPPGTEAAAGPRDAIPHLEWLDAREDRTATYADQLAALYAGERDLDRAWAKAQRAVRIGPYETRLRERAAAVALLRQDFDAARTQIEAMIVLEPDRPVHRQRLEALKRRTGN